MRLAAFALVAALVPGIGLPTRPPALPVSPPPEVTAEAWLIYDAGTGTILASENAAEPRAMASVTKLMTALVVSQNAGLDEAAVVSARAAGTGEAEIGLVDGEVWTVRELLTAILVRSGNDAAVALAEHVGGSEEGFVAMMNATAARLGLANTSFANPHGLDAVGHHTSAEDLLALTEIVLDDPVLARLVRTRVVKFRPDPEGNPRRAVNTNKLLGAYPGVAGVKTGFTGDAGLVLVSMARRGPRELIAVVMASQDHFADSRLLLEYGFRALGPADILRAPLAGEQGGGGVVGVPVPEWLAVRLVAVPGLDGGRWAISTSTPAEDAITARLEALVPPFLGSR